MGECVDKLLGKTPEGEIYLMKLFNDGKVTFELLSRQVIFEPKMLIHNGQISFGGTFIYEGKQQEIIIPGTNEAVKLFEKAVGI